MKELADFADFVRLAQVSLPAILPLFILSVGAGVVPLLSALGRKGQHIAPVLTLAVLAAAGVVSVRGLGVIDANENASAPYHGFIHHDVYAVFATLLFIVGASMVTLLSWRYVETVGSNYPEYYALTLFATAGMVVMAQANDLLALFLGLEILSLAFYALTGMSKTSEATEAAMKYFLMGAFAAGFYLMGAAFVFGATATTRFDGFVAGATSPLLPIGVSLLLGSMAFKLALPPFHMWAPDAYQGAPSSVTAFMAFGTKAAVVFALGRVVAGSSLDIAPDTWVAVAVTLAVVAMIWGNTVALAQGHLRRLIAYSSISHAGVIVLGLAAGREGVSGVLFYLVAYTFSIVGLFAVVVALRRKGSEVVLIRDLAGLSHKSPVLSGLMTLFLLSLAGFPPTAGFLAKFLVFRAAVQQDLVMAAVLGALASVVGVFYYLYIVVTMYMHKPIEDEPVTARTEPALALALGMAFLGTLPLGLFPEQVLQFAEAAVRSLS